MYAGPLNSRACPSCKRHYFAGALPGAQVLGCAGFYGWWVAVQTFDSQLIGVLLLAIGIGLMVLVPLLSQPVPREFRWRSVLGLACSPLLLWILMDPPQAIRQFFVP